MPERRSSLAGKKILAVDDEKDILETIVEQLAAADVDVASDFKTAADKISKNPYDLTMLDIMGVDGLTLLKMAVEKEIPAVMLTAYALNYKTLMLSIRYGSIAFLPKEKLAELDRMLEMLMGAHEAGESTWKVLFDEIGDFFNERFGQPMGTVEWICRQIKSGKMKTLP
jgi:DNA-binding NtrC family response regulator